MLCFCAVDVVFLFIMSIKIILFFSFLLILSSGYATEKAPMLGAEPFEIPAWFKNSFLDLAAEVEKSAAADKQLMLMFHQAACPYCAKLIHNNFAQDNIKNYFQQHFDAIEINLWGDREVTDFSGNTLSEKQFAVHQKVWATPTLLFFNTTGELVRRIEGYYPPEPFLSALQSIAEQHPGQTHQAQTGALPDADFFAPPPYNLSIDAGSQPIAVFFAEPNCAACEELHQQTLSKTATQDLLKNFYSIQLNRWSGTPVITPDGQRLSAKQWADKLDIHYLPSIVLFDEQQEVMRIASLFKSFHVQSILAYIASGSYQKEQEFQRYIHQRAEQLREQGIAVDLWD